MIPYFSLALENLRHRKKRAYLTIVGIFIGIMAVVALVSLGQGLQQGVNEEFNKLGLDKIFIQPSGAFAQTTGGTSASAITDQDLDRVRNVLGVVEVGGLKFRSAKIDWSDITVYELAYEMPQDNRERALTVETFTIETVEGRLLEAGDRTAVLIGSNYLDRTRYSDPLSIGRSVKINNVSVRVVGILKKTGDPGVDNAMFITTAGFDQAFPSAVGEYDYVIVRIEPGAEPTFMAERIKEALRKLRDVKEGEEDFTVQTTDDLKESFDQILGIIQVVLTGIALISLVVGAVGITNTMYTAVLERTKEIGIMKAVGARNEDILSIFLIESGLLGVAGGAVGVTLGLGISYAASVIAEQALGSAIIHFYASWWLILGALGFSFIIGVAAGYLPAKQAANMQPVDSLRYE